ncbi:transcriptional repressor TraM [Neorhizobium alkalisoli]|uniref:Transcriptional repressor TraM n=1 Tax=Neorhizobium alkalisoli TaxID=528178 RepID=A0A561PZ97_9HYPH|nr:transcriptional repressor TraM [Neorhizobium alkalisoli]TWF43440.1 transcriptional repressor TraM [Neorhizobium alkalisoli]
MTQVGNGEGIHVDLRPLIGLLNGVSEPVIERLASDAVRKHRDLVERAETLFNDLPDDVKMGRQAAGEDHLAYLKATIDMHAQMSALTTLLKILGRTPSV